MNLQSLLRSLGIEKPKPTENLWWVEHALSAPLEVRLEHLNLAKSEAPEKWLYLDGSQQVGLFLFKKKLIEIFDIWLDTSYSGYPDGFVALCESAYRALKNLGGNSSELSQLYGIEQRELSFLFNKWLFAAVERDDKNITLMRLVRDKAKDAVPSQDAGSILALAYLMDEMESAGQQKERKYKTPEEATSAVETKCKKTLSGLAYLGIIADKAIEMGIDFGGDLSAIAYKTRIANEMTFLLDLLSRMNPQSTPQNLKDFVTSELLLRQVTGLAESDAAAELKAAASSIKGANLRVVDEVPAGYVGLRSAAEIVARRMKPKNFPEGVTRQLPEPFDLALEGRVEGVRIRGTTGIYISESSLERYCRNTRSYK